MTVITLLTLIMMEDYFGSTPPMEMQQEIRSRRRPTVKGNKASTRNGDAKNGTFFDLMHAARKGGGRQASVWESQWRRQRHASREAGFACRVSERGRQSRSQSCTT